MNIPPNLMLLFLLQILFAVVLGSIFLFLAIYVVRENRVTERNRVAARENQAGKEARSLPETVFYYLRTGRLRGSIDMRVRLYSLEDYDTELGGKREASRSDGFVAALKAYGYHDDDWHPMSCKQAISSLGLEARECEADNDCGTILLRKLPEGLPDKAGDKLDQPEDLRLFAPEGRSLQSVSPDRLL